MAFLKLDAAILDSSIWCQSPVVRCVWITMLVMADQENADGLCPATAPGISNRARVSLKQTRAALAILEAPDPDDKSGVDEGRRIRRVRGGYQIVNYLTHQKKDHTAAERQRRHRAKSVTRDVTPVTRDSHAVTRDVTHSDSYSDSDLGKDVGSSSLIPSSTTEKPSSADALAKPVAEAKVYPWSRQACDDWIARFGGTAPGGVIGKALRPLVDRHGWPMVRKAWIRYLTETEAQYAAPMRFSATFGKWAGLAPDPPSKDDVGDHNERVMRSMLGPDLGGLGAAVKSMPKLKG